MLNTRRSFFQGLAGVAAVAPLALAKTEPVVEATMNPRSLGVTSLHPVIPEGSTIHEFNSLSKVPAHARRGWDIRWTGLKENPAVIEIAGQWAAAKTGEWSGCLYAGCPGGSGWLNRGAHVYNGFHWSEGQREIESIYPDWTQIALEQRALAYEKLVYLIDNLETLYDKDTWGYTPHHPRVWPPWMHVSLPSGTSHPPSQWVMDRLGPVCRAAFEAEIKAWKLG
jgi:hypothetical protein